MTARLKELSRDQQRAGIAAIALFFTLLLPWYSQSRVIGGSIQSERLSAFRVFSFVEAAVLLTAASVLYLLYARSQRKGFHLPGGDGWAITIAGGWSVFLLVWRLFDKPEFNGGPVGVEWGLFVAIVVAGVVVAAGQKLRAAREPEPPNPAADPLWETPARPERDDHQRRRPVDPGAVTRTLREDRPTWEGDPPERQ